MASNVKLSTNHGDIVIELNEEKAPKTVANFIKYVKSGHYSNCLFHRVIDGFMVQGGGFDESMNQKEAIHTVENEADNGLKNKNGTVAMARTNDPHSGGAQFFINVAENGFLDHTSKTAQGWGYAVFGEVTSGMDVVGKITKVKTSSHGLHKDVPAEPVMITKAAILDAKAS